MRARAFICGCSGLTLTAQERAFIAQQRPWGLIVFKRNVESPAQVAALIAQFREILDRPDAPALVDQEGGRVQRLGPPHWRAYPAAARLARAGDRDGDLVRLAARLMAHDLRALGINVDCLPVLDLPAPGAHEVIGARAYGDQAADVARLGGAAAAGLLAGGVLPVMKHIPGHGRANADTHFDLPVVETSEAELRASDFEPFRLCRHLPMAMSAHVVFAAIDPDRPATTSPKVVDRVIRGHIGFDGLLMSDDVSMKALRGGFAERTQALFSAGLDMALHCNGDLAEAAAVASASPWLAGAALERAARALAALSAPDPFDPVDAARRLDAALAAAA